MSLAYWIPAHQALLELLSRHCYHVHSRNVLWLVSLVHHRYLIMNHAVCIINNNLIIHLSRSLFTDLITNKVVIRKYTFGTSVPTCLFHKLYTVTTPTFWYRWFALSQRYSNIRPGWQCSNIWHNETEVAVKIIGSLTSRNFTSSKKKKKKEMKYFPIGLFPVSTNCSGVFDFLDDGVELPHFLVLHTYNSFQWKHTGAWTKGPRDVGLDLSCSNGVPAPCEPSAAQHLPLRAASQGWRGSAAQLQPILHSAGEAQLLSLFT